MKCRGFSGGSEGRLVNPCFRIRQTHRRILFLTKVLRDITKTRSALCGRTVTTKTASPLIRRLCSAPAMSNRSSGPDRPISAGSARLDEAYEFGRIRTRRYHIEARYEQFRRTDRGVGRKSRRLAGCPADALQRTARREQLPGRRPTRGAPTLSSATSTGVSISSSPTTTSATPSSFGPAPCSGHPTEAITYAPPRMAGRTANRPTTRRAVGQHTSSRQQTARPQRAGRRYPRP